MATSNKEYGSYYRSHSSKRQSIGKNTLDFLKKNDVGNYLHQQQNIAQRSRHGLFTQPMGLANGDQYHDKKPQQVPKNMSINNRLVQKVGPELFEKMGSTNIGDLYKDKFRQNQLYVKQKADLNIHPTNFIAGGKQKLVKHSEFQHIKQFEDKAYNTRDQKGNVKTGLKNITTNNMKKGFGNTTMGHLFGHYKYEGSPYDNSKELETKQKLVHKAKISQPFIGSSKPQDVFTPGYQTFHLQGEPYQPIKDDTQYRSKTSQKWSYNNPNKKGFYGTFTEFPKYIEEGEAKKRQTQHQNVWKPNFNGTSKGLGETLTKPSPVPSQMVLNNIRRGS